MKTLSVTEIARNFSAVMDGVETDQEEIIVVRNNKPIARVIPEPPAQNAIEVLGDLYRTKGVYTYSGGWNWRAVVATLLGCALAWIGLVVSALRPLYDYAWFVGFGTAALAHYLLMRFFPPAQQPDLAV